MQFNELAATHFEWVDQMGWHNKSMLETLGLIASEIGEAFAECTGPVPSDAFGQELADIALRLMDVAHGQNIDIDAEVRTCSPIWAVGRTVHCALGQLVVDLAKAINACRGDTLGPDFKPSLVSMLARVDVLGRLLPETSLETEIRRKMDINKARGTRGRRL